MKKIILLLCVLCSSVAAQAQKFALVDMESNLKGMARRN